MQGTLYIKDETTLLIKNFGYNGDGPDAFFYVGTDGQPSGSGRKLTYPGDSSSKLEAFNNEDVEIKLPAGYEASKLKWFSVWCRQFAVNFGDVIFETRAATSEEAESEETQESASEESDDSSTEDSGESGSSTSGEPENGSSVNSSMSWVVMTSAFFVAFCFHLIRNE